MKTKRTNPDFLNGVPELLVLQLLQRRPMYGYVLVQALQASNEEALSFGEGCIYPILHRLEREKLLDGRTEIAAGRKRVVYHVTAAGRKRLVERIDAWERVTQAIQKALAGESDARPQLA